MMRGTTPSTGGMPSCSHALPPSHVMASTHVTTRCITPPFSAHLFPSARHPTAAWLCRSARPELCHAVQTTAEQPDAMTRSDKMGTGSTPGPMNALARARAMLRGTRTSTSVDKLPAATSLKGIPPGLLKKDSLSSSSAASKAASKAGSARSASRSPSRTVSAASSAVAAPSGSTIAAQAARRKSTSHTEAGGVSSTRPAAAHSVMRVSYSNKARALIDLALRMGPEGDGDPSSMSSDEDADDLPSLLSILTIGRGGTVGGISDATRGGSDGTSAGTSHRMAGHSGGMVVSLGGSLAPGVTNQVLAAAVAPEGVGLHNTLAAEHLLVPDLVSDRARQSLEALLAVSTVDASPAVSLPSLHHGAVQQARGHTDDDAVHSSDDMLASDSFPEDVHLGHLPPPPLVSGDAGRALMPSSPQDVLSDVEGLCATLDSVTQHEPSSGSVNSTSPAKQQVSAPAQLTGAKARRAARRAATAATLALNNDVIDDLVSSVKHSADGVRVKRTRANSKALETAAAAAIAAAAALSSSSSPIDSSSTTARSGHSITSAPSGTAPGLLAVTKKRSRASSGMPQADALSAAAVGGDVEQEEVDDAAPEEAPEEDAAPAAWSRTARAFKLEPDVLARLLSRHQLPPDVAAGLTEAVARGQLPLTEDSMGRTLDRLLGDKQLDQALVLTVLRKFPAVLKQTNVILRSKHARLVHLLDCDKDVVNKILSNVPSLWGLKIETLRLKVDVLQKLLQLGRREVLLLVRKCPGLLASDSNTLSEKFKSLMCLVAQPQRDVVKMVVQAPTVLFLNSDNLAIKFRAFAAAMDVSMEDLGNMAVVKPQLITSSTETVLASWTLIAQAAAKSARWTKELKALGPGTRSAIALSGRLKLKRLAYLVDTAQPETYSLSSTLGMSQANFVKRFPEFRVWSRLQTATS